MTKKIAYIVDSSSSYNLNLPNTYVLPMIISVENSNGLKTYIDTKDITRNELKKIIDDKTNKIKTSQPIIGEIMETIKKLSTEYDLVIAIPFSKYLSNTFNTFKSIINELKLNNVLLADTNAMSITGNWLIDDINQFINNEGSISQSQLNKLAAKATKNQCGVVMLSDLTHLIAGGRLTGVKGLIAKTIKLKLGIKYKGKLEMCEKDLSFDGLIDKCLKMIDKSINFTKFGINKMVIFADFENNEFNKKYIEYIKNKFPNINIEYALLPSAVICHTGLNTLSIIIESK